MTTVARLPATTNTVTRVAVKASGATFLVAVSIVTGWLALPVTTLAATTFVVNKTGDASDLHGGDGKCDSSTASGSQCTLRAAIQETNALAGADTINFNITTTSKTISPVFPLPSVTGRVTIDGYSQSGASANTKANADNAVLKIVIDGTNAGSDTLGLDLEGANIIVRGLVIRDFSGPGVLVGGSNNTVRGNFIGTNTAGTVAAPNATGVEVLGANNVIGGTAASARNLVSGNEGDGIDVVGAGATGNLVQGNFIGTDKTGKASVPNGTGVDVLDAPSNTIGGTASGARNLISGNSGTALFVGGTTGLNLSVVQGNYIGTDVTGSVALGNGGHGILIRANAVTIGGTTAAARNVISANALHGILIFASSGPAPEGNVIQGNYVGTDASGSTPLGNSLDGVIDFGGHNTLIGGSVAGAGNLISSNGNDGILLFTNTSAATVQGNKIGTRFDGTGLLGNAMNGIQINGSNSNTIGGPGLASNLIEHSELDAIAIVNSTGNLITGNSVVQNGGQGVDASSGPNTISSNSFVNDDEGVRVETTATGIRISGNQMVNNGGFGIHLMGGVIDSNGVVVNDAGDADTGANNLQNFPVLSSAIRLTNGVTTVTGSLNSNANTTFRIELFLVVADPSGHGEALALVGSKNITTDSGGNRGFSFASVQLAGGQVLTATATSVTAGNTSEFSANVLVVQAP